jgi:hypothetical protein
MPLLIQALKDLSFYAVSCLYMSLFLGGHGAAMCFSSYETMERHCVPLSSSAFIILEMYFLYKKNHVIL